jgi:3-oxoacyl-[acyl-carrier-protein] synthase II
VRGAGPGGDVAVTGLGVVSGCGVGVDALWAGLQQEPEPARVRTVPHWDPSPWMSGREARLSDRFTQLAVAAAALALSDAGLDPAAVDPTRAAVQIGTGIGGVASFETMVRTLDERGADRVSPFSIPMIMPNAAGAVVSIRLGWRGPVETLTTACAAGTHSIGAAARLVALGVCDVALAGAADCSLVTSTIAGFTNAGAMSRSGRSRPFDRHRDGFVAGEGAGLLVLERLAAARARGARVYAVVAGTASTADAHDLTAPSPGGAGARECMSAALADAGLDPAAVCHVNAHGTATPTGDAAEASAIHALLAGRRVPVTSVKGVLGHAFGAAGAIEAVVACAGFARRAIPPTAGFEQPDDVTAVLDVVTALRPWEPGPMLTNSFGFGGHNATLVLVPAPA